MNARALTTVLKIAVHWTLFLSATWMLATVGPTLVA